MDVVLVFLFFMTFSCQGTHTGYGTICQMSLTGIRGPQEYCKISMNYQIIAPIIKSSFLGGRKKTAGQS